MGLLGTPEVLLLSEEVTRRYGKWRPPDQDKAAIHHRAEHAHHDFFDVWSSKVRDFKEFGIGHMMYFCFLSWMAMLFGALAVITGLPNMALNYFGRYYDTGTLEMTTLGNFGAVSWSHHNDGPLQMAKLTNADGWQREAFISSLFMNTTTQAPSTHPFNKQQAIIAMSVLDFVGVVLYFAVTFGLVWVARTLVHDADVNTVTIHDYSIRVERLPDDATADELAEFFTQYGEVVHVEMIRAYGRLVRKVLKRGQLLHHLQAATASLQKEALEWTEVPASKEAACYKIKDEIDQLSQEIQVEQSMADSRRVVGAFVTFKEEVGKLACLRAQPHNRMRQWWALKPEHKLRRRHALNITDAPEPSDVQYENIEHGTVERSGRASLVFCCSYTCLALGFCLISLASAMRLNLSKVAGVKTSDCNSSCRLEVNGALAISDADRVLYASCGTTGKTPNGTECADLDDICYKCYCSAAITAGLLGESAYCKGVAKIIVLQYSSQVTMVLAILVINSVLSFTSRSLTLFEKNHTRSGEAKSLAQKLFLAQFLNSALSTIIANAHLPFLADAMNGTVLDGLFFQGIFTDLTPNWYKLVGRSLLVSQFVGAALRVFNLFVKWAQAKYAYRNRHKCLTQHALQESIRGPSFELDVRYGEHLNVIYVSMLLSGGIPLSYLAAAFWFTTSYWCDKFELLTLSRRPVTYGAGLSDMAIKRLPYAAIVHVVLSIWAFSMFGVPRSKVVTAPFASLINFICRGMAVVWQNASDISAEQAAERLLAANSLHLLILLIIFVALLFFNIIRSNLYQAGRWMLSMVGVIADKMDDEVTGVPEFPIAVRTQLLVGESSYAIQAQPEYAAAFTRMEDAVGDVLVQVVMKKGAGMLAGSKQQTSPRKPSELEPASPHGFQQQPLSKDVAAVASTTTRRTRTPIDAWQPQQQEQQQRQQWHESRQAAADSGVQDRHRESRAADPPPDAEASDEPQPITSNDGPRLPQRLSTSDGARAGSVSTDRGGGTPDSQMTATQRYRKARANQIAPVSQDYVAAARAADRME